MKGLGLRVMGVYFHLDMDLVSSRHELKNIAVSMRVTRKYNVCVYSDYAKSYFDQGCDSIRIMHGVEPERYGHSEYTNTAENLEFPIYAQSKKDGMFYEVGTGDLVDKEIREGVVICFDMATFDKFVRERTRLRNICYILFCSQDEYTSERLFNVATLDVNLYKFDLYGSIQDEYYGIYPYYDGITWGCGFLSYDFDEYNFFGDDEGRPLRNAVRGIIREFIGETKTLTLDNYRNYYTHLRVFSPDFFTSVVYGNCDWCKKLSDKVLRCIYNFNINTFISECEDPIPYIGFNCGVVDIGGSGVIDSYESYYFNVDLVDLKGEMENGTAEPIELKYKLIKNKYVTFDFEDWHFAIKLDGKFDKETGINMIPSKYIKGGYILYYKTKWGTYYRFLRFEGRQISRRFDTCTMQRCGGMLFNSKREDYIRQLLAGLEK